MTGSEYNASDVKEISFAIYLHFAAPLDIASAAAQPRTGSAGSVSMPRAEKVRPALLLCRDRPHLARRVYTRPAGNGRLMQISLETRPQL